FAAQKMAENWTGDGTEEHPYIIEGYNITFSGFNILISNVTVYFEIRDCLLISTHYLPQMNEYDEGICIVYSTNGVISNNEIRGGDAGIFTGWSTDIEIIGNQISRSDRNCDRGIILYNSTGIAAGNSISDCDVDGIWVTGSSDVRVESNIIHEGGTSIAIESSNSIQVSRNEAFDTGGIWIYDCYICSIVDNEMFNGPTGISLVESSNVSVLNNNFDRTDPYGIHIQNSRSCFYDGNRITRCDIGFFIENGASSTFSFNYIVGSYDSGIVLLSGYNNIIYGNLLENGLNAFDNGENNQWDDGVSIGNYWSSDFGLDPVSIPGDADSVDSYPIEILPFSTYTIGSIPAICNPPIIQVSPVDTASLKWVAWGVSDYVYTLTRNGSETDSSIWTGSGSYTILLSNLPDGVYSFRFSIWDGSSPIHSDAIIRVPGFELLNDYDGDGMLDLWEFEYGFNPAYEGDASEDVDEDELTNLQEYNLGTNPYSDDSDGDSISDLWEVSNGFDPTNPNVPLIEIVLFFQAYVIGVPSAFLILGGVAMLLKSLPEEKKSRLPIKGPISYALLLKVIIAFFILLLIPLEIDFTEDYTAGALFLYYSLASVFIQQSRLQTPEELAIWSASTELMQPITLLAAIAILIPSVYLILKLRNHPGDQPTLNMTTATLFATIILTTFFVEMFPPSELFWIFQSNPASILRRFGTLVIFVFIVLPILSREAFLWGKDRLLEKTKTSKSRIPWPNRFSVIGCLWGLMVFLIPSTAVVQIWNPTTTTLGIESPLYAIRQTISNAPAPGNVNDWMVFSVDIYPVFDFITSLALSVFHILFGFYVLRYLRGMIRRKRVIQLGILSGLAPILYYFMASYNLEIEAIIAIPIPIALICGVVAMVMIVPNVPEVRVEEPKEEGIIPSPKIHHPIPPEEPSIQVPFIYYMKSKLRDFFRRKAESEAP
ncbi:MAG: NosD domain-containing protein, partial [Candidatus Thorarchaeota archaeon]